LCVRSALVRTREDRDLRSPLAGQEAYALALGLLEREAADRRLRLVLDPVLVLVRAGPVDAQEPALAVEHLLELVVGAGRAGVRVRQRSRLSEHRRLDPAEEPDDRIAHARGRHAELLALFPRPVTAREHDGVALDVARSDLDAHRDAAHLPVVELEAR